jgi:RecA/RadA recombinase
VAEKKDKGTGTPAGFVDRRNAGAILRKLNEVHGEGTLVIASQGRRTSIDRISTGSLALDFALGGGLPVGRIIKIVGQESSGKTTLSLRAVADAQRRCANCLRYVRDLGVAEVVDEGTGEVSCAATGTCDCVAAGIYVPQAADGEKEADFKARVAALHVNSFEELRVAFVDVEGALDLSWAQRVGVDTRRLVHAVPDTAEKAVDVYCELLYSGLVDVIVLDSIAAMAPRDEVESSANDQQQGLAARIINKFVRRANAGALAVELGAGRRMPTQIWLNQLRQKIGAYGEGLVEPGGMGQKFAASVKIKMWASGWEKRDLLRDLAADERIKMGKTVDVNWMIEKNKCGPARGEGKFVQIASGARMGEIDEFGFLAHLAENKGLLRKNEKGTAWLLGDKEYRKKQDAFDKMREPATAVALRKVLMQKLNEERDED